MSIETCNGTAQARTARDVAVSACQQCNLLTEEIGAAMDRIEVLIAERDMARARNSELEKLARDLEGMVLEMRAEVTA